MSARSILTEKVEIFNSVYPHPIYQVVPDILISWSAKRFETFGPTLSVCLGSQSAFHYLWKRILPEQLPQGVKVITSPDMTSRSDTQQGTSFLCKFRTRSLAGATLHIRLPNPAGIYAKWLPHATSLSRVPLVVQPPCLNVLVT